LNKQRLFGTDGVRGVANSEPITSETALKLGRALDGSIEILSGINQGDSIVSEGALLLRAAAQS